MIFRLILLFFTCAHLSICAQNDPEPFGSRAGALANTSVALIDVWSIQNNQAGLAYLEKMEVAAFYKNRFFIEGLDYQGVGFVLPTSSGTFGLSYIGDGTDLYKESKLGLSYGRKLGNILSMGVQLNYHNTRIIAADYGNTSAITGEIGLIANVNDELRLAAHLYNPGRTVLIQEPLERIPTIFKVGALYTFSDRALITAEVMKDVDADEAIRFGAEYMVVDMVFIRAGVGTAPTLTAFGIGMEVSQLKLDVAATYDNQLGYSPTISLSYQINRNEKE